MPDEVTDSSSPDRDEEQDERLKRLEDATSGGKVGFDSLVKWAKGVGTIIGVVAVVIGYGVQWGKFTTAIETNTKAITKLQERQTANEEKALENLSKLRDAVQERLRQDESAVGEIRGSLMALRTEVRVRHEEVTYTKTMPTMLPPGFEPGMPMPPGQRPRKVVPPQAVQEDLAAKASDLAIDKAVKAVQNQKADPLKALAF